MQKTLEKWRVPAEKVRKAGGELYLVGGVVRDYFMGIQPHDVDLCVTGLSVAKFLELFPTARQQGKAFPVFVVDGAEVAFARTEKKNGYGYHEFEVNTNPNITIEEDLFRRELTMNSMAVHVLTGKLIDPYDGMDSIERRTLRPTSNAFMEDPVRALRAARFLAETGFFPSVGLKGMMIFMKSEMHTVSNDMKLKEVRKALKSENPDVFFRLLKATGLLEDLFPEVHALIGVPQAHHNDGDVFDHTMRVLRYLRTLTDDEIILYAGLSHDFGKARTSQDILPAHYNHEIGSAEVLAEVVWIPSDWRAFATTVALEHMRGHRFNEMRLGNKVAFLERFKRTSKGLEGFTKVLRADKPTAETEQTVLSMLAMNARITAVTGHCVPENIPRDSNFGKILHELRVKACRV